MNCELILLELIHQHSFGQWFRMIWDSYTSIYLIDTSQWFIQSNIPWALGNHMHTECTLTQITCQKHDQMGKLTNIFKKTCLYWDMESITTNTLSYIITMSCRSHVDWYGISIEMPPIKTVSSAQKTHGLGPVCTRTIGSS